MADEKDGVLPLVGRVFKKRLGEFKREATKEVREGYAEFKRELERELDGKGAEDAEEGASDSNGPSQKVRVKDD